MEISIQAIIMVAMVFGVAMYFLFGVLRAVFEATESYPESQNADMRCPSCNGELEDLMEIESKNPTFMCRDCGRKETILHTSR